MARGHASQSLFFQEQIECLMVENNDLNEKLKAQEDRRRKVAEKNQVSVLRGSPPPRGAVTKGSEHGRSVCSCVMVFLRE